jgi:hypothetical protein
LRAVRLVDSSGIWSARRRARAILTEHQRDVEHLAERLAAAPGHELAF